MKKISYPELKKALVKHNVDNNITVKLDNNPLFGVIVFKPEESGWKDEYLNCSFEERAYIVSSCNKAFIPHQLGYSIFADNIADTDHPRLEQYMKDEGIKDGWVVDYCYLREETNV